MFRQYPKILHLDKEENEGLLEDVVIVQEKLDGANTSIWIEKGVAKYASRRREITEGFNGFIEYIQAHEGVKQLLLDHPDFRLYGEWLVKHSLVYKETAYRKFYLFDILKKEKFLDQETVRVLAKKYDIDFPCIFFKGKATREDIMKFVGKSELAEQGEGVVIKNPNFINKFGKPSYAKLVTQEFKEKNALTFGGNNKRSDTYWEMYVVNKYCSLARVKKIMNKLQPIIDEKLDKKHTSRVAHTCYHDLVVEEIWAIVKKVPRLYFKVLKRLACKKFIQIYHDILDDTVSVADTPKSEKGDV